MFELLFSMSIIVLLALPFARDLVAAKPLNTKTILLGFGTFAGFFASFIIKSMTLPKALLAAAIAVFLIFTLFVAFRLLRAKVSKEENNQIE